MLLGKEKQRIIKMPVEDVIIDSAIVDYLTAHSNNDKRWQYASFIIPTLKQPNEIWLSRYSDGSIRPNYISFFKGDRARNFVVIIKIAKDGQLVYNAIPKSKAKNINRSKDGILQYAKKWHSIKSIINSGYLGGMVSILYYLMPMIMILEYKLNHHHEQPLTRIIADMFQVSQKTICSYF